MYFMMFIININTNIIVYNFNTSSANYITIHNLVDISYIRYQISLNNNSVAFLIISAPGEKIFVKYKANLKNQLATNTFCIYYVYIMYYVYVYIMYYMYVYIMYYVYVYIMVHKSLIGPHACL